VQFFGAHIGAGAPPSANDAVDTAPSSSMVARTKRTIFFTKNPLLWKFFHLQYTLLLFPEGVRSVRKTRASKAGFRRFADKLPGLTTGT
jgi:hypothetical protein